MATTLPPIKYVNSPNQSDRAAGVKVDLIVLHDTEGGYDGAVNWFRSTASEVSAHLVLKEDGSEATQMVPYSKKAWHCAAFNSRSIGLEMAGFTKLGFKDPQLRRAARIVAFLCHKNGIPPKHVKPKSVSDPVSGFTLHQDLGVAGGGHHDPGFSRWKAAWFARLVKQEFKNGGFRKSWGR